MADQQRYDALSIMGNDLLKTPNMDRIGNEGATFLNAFSQCAVCGPARTSLLTGHSTANTNVKSNEDTLIPDKTKVPTYDEILVNELGLTAEYYGKWHAPKDLSRVYRNTVNYPNLIKPYRNYLDDVGVPKPEISKMKKGTQIQTLNKRPYTTNPLDSRYGDPPGSNRGNNGNPLRQPDQHGISDVPKEHTLTDFNAKNTINAMEQLAQDGKPFSLHCSFFAPHPSITPSEPFASMYDPDDMVPPASIDDEMKNSPYRNANKRRQLT